MVKERFDKSLFGAASEAAKAEDVWQQGIEGLNQPVGTFQVDIVTAVLERSQSSDRLQIHYELVVLAGANKDLKFDKYDGLETPDQTRISQAQLSALGVNVKKTSINALPAILLDLTHKKATIKTKQNGAFFNIYFQKLITGMPSSVPGTRTTPRRKTTKKKVSTSKKDRAF